ncbi:hypothetical protein JKF63_06723 [Porcisia hertigi]|uniref:Uncharacterized protein n=1 Tax=Porcisia hertigi TaxID=2761500 RepID=A0A836IZD5_9TRYP|nr:hypothetical protein JKF63_06723 [Porcisia hertigi]
MEAAVGQLMPMRGDKLLVDATPSVASTIACGGNSVVSSRALSGVGGMATATSPEREGSSRTAKNTIGVASSPPVSSADAVETLLAAIAKYVHRRLLVPSAGDDSGTTQPSSIAKDRSMAKQLYSPAAGEASSTPSARADDSGDDVDEEHLITCAQQVEDHLLRCLLYVQLAPGGIPSQPELIGDYPSMPSAITLEKAGAEGSGAQIAAPHVVTSTRSTCANATGVEGEESPPPRHPSARRVADKYGAVENTEVRSRSWSSLSTPVGASSSAHARVSSSNAKAKELYYTYTRRGVPSSPPRQRGGAAAVGAVEEPHLAKKRHQSASRGSADVKAFASNSFALPPPEADSLDGALPAASGGFSALPPTRRGVVRPLHATEINAAMRSWPSRIAQYVLAATLAEKELRSAMEATDSSANVRTPTKHECTSNDARTSSAHGGGTALNKETIFQVGESTEKGTDEEDVVIDAILRQLSDVLHHTPLSAGTGDTGAGQPPTIAFPSFARFYLADGGAGGILGGSGTDEHGPSQRVREEGNVHAYLARLAKVLLSTLDAGATRLAHQDNAISVEERLVLSGDIVTTIGVLLKRTPLITVPTYPSASPAGAPVLPMANNSAAATPVTTAKDAVWRALRSLLHLSPSSRYNPTMCTTPFVVGLVRRYTPGRKPRSDDNPDSSGGGGGGGTNLRVRLLPVADVFPRTDGAATAMTALEADHELRGFQDGAHDLLRTPAFYTAAVLEVTGEDVLYSTTSHADAVSLEEEAAAKVRYETDVPEAYRDLYSRRMAAAQNGCGVYPSSATTLRGEGQGRKGGSEFSDKNAALAETSNALERATTLSALDRCLSRQECALWGKLLAIAQFVQVSGTPVEVETTARYVTLAIRHRRTARQRSECDSQQVDSPNVPVVSITESVSSPSVPAFFFTLTETSALRSAAAAAAATAVEARRRLFCGARHDDDDDDDDDEDATLADATQGVRAESEGAQSSSAAGNQPCRFLRSTGLSLRGLLGWGKAAPLEGGSGQPTSSNIDVQHYESSNAIRAQPRRRGRGLHVRAALREPLAPTMQGKSPEELIMDWMHDVLIPLFFETTVSGGFVSQHGLTASAKSSKGNDGDDSEEEGGSAEAATAARKRAPYHLRSQRVLLGRVQAVTPSMVYGSRRITVARMEAVVRERAFDTDLLSYLLLNQLFFDPELSSADAVNVPVRRARSAPLPERTLHQRRSATDERQQTQEEGSRPRRPHTIRALSTLVTTAVSPHSPSLQTRRVSFREVDSGVTPQRLALPRLADDNGIQSQLLQQSPTTTAAASAERQTSLAGSPRSILKSGRRYKREKLICSSAPAASIVPFRNLFLWRWLVAEVLGRGDNGGRGVSRLQQEQQQQQQHQKEVGDISAVSTTLCITAAGYLHRTQALAVRLASDVATAVLLSGLLAELYACSKEVRGDEHCHEGGSPVVTERDCGASRGEAAVVEGEGTAKKTPAELITEEVRWRALSCDDLPPLANRAALAFVRAALAPLLCNPTDNPALPAGDSSRVIVDVDVCYVCDKEECRREWWCDDTHSEETSTGSHPGRSDKTEKSTPPHRRRLPGPSVVSLLCPDLSTAARHRLQTLSRLSLLHVRHEVLDSITRPLDVVLRRLTWALATHRLRALRQPLDDFLGRGDVIAVLRGSVGGARRVQAERQLWQHVHEVVVQCEECLLLPHLITNTGAPMWGTEPITLAEESETVVSEAAMNGDEEGDGKASARAPDEKVRWASLKKEAACPQHADNQESTTTLSVAAVASAATEGGSGTSLSQLRVEQRETLVGGSAQRGGFKFVPLSFANVSVGPARPPSLSPAQVAVLQPRSSPSPLTCVPRGWNPPFLDTDDSKNLYSYPFDGRGLRLVSTAAQVDDRNSGVGDAASDFIKAAGSALGWQRSPLFGVGTRTDKTETGAVFSVVSRDGSVDDDNTSAASPDLRTHLASKSALDAARALPCCSSSDVSCVIEAASPVRLFHSTTTTLDLPLPTVPKATEGGRLSGSPLILVDAHSTAAPQFASTATCSTPSGCDHSPPCADSSLSGTSHLRPQRAQVSSHRLSVLTLASAVPISRRLQVHTFGVCEMDGGSAEEEEQTPQKSSLASQQQQQQLPLPQSPGITPHRQSHLAAVREGAGAQMMQTTKQAAGESPTSPEEGADAAVPTSKASGMSFVVQARGGAVGESSLLSPFVTEAKRVVAGAFLQRCVLPLWTRLILIKEQEVGKGNAREGEGNTDTRDTMPARHEAEPQPLPRLGTRSGFSLSSPTAREAVSTASASAAAATPSSKAESLLTRHVEKLTRENVELHRRLQDTNRLLADLRQTCCGLHMAAQQYELAVVLQRENAKGRGVVVAATDFTDTSESLAGGDGDGGGRRTVPIPQHLNLASPSPLSSESHMASREGAVDMREPDGDATADERRNSDASLFQSGSVFLVSPLAESMPPDTWYLRRTKEGCDRVLELCQRMVARLSGTADPEDNKGEAAVCLPASAVAYSSDLSPQHHSSASPLVKPDFFPLHFLSQRILSPRCPSPPEPMSAELGSPAKLCGEYSGLRGHSTVSHGPSQLFNPLEPQSFRRNSAAFTLVSLAPSGAVAMSSTIPAETPGSTQASTPIAVFFVGTASNPSIRSSPVSLSPKKTALQNMPPLSVTSQHPVALSFGNADVNLSRPLKAAYPAAALSFDLEEAAPSVQLYAIPPMEKSPPLIIEASDSHTSSADAQNKTKIPPSCAASSERVPEDSSSTPVQPSLELAAVLVSSSSQTRHASPHPCTTAADDLETGAHTPDDYHRHHRDALSSPSSAPSGHSSSSLPRPPSFPSSPSTAPFEKSSKLPFEDPNERCEGALVATMATAHTRTPPAALIRDDDNRLQGRTIFFGTTVATAAVEAWCDGGLAAFPVDEDNMRVTAADGKRQLVRDERVTDVAEDTLRANSAGDLSELLAVQQQANEASHPQPSRCDNPFPLPSALLITPCRQLQYRESTSQTPSRPQESDPFVNTLPGRVSVGTQSSPQIPSSTFTQTLQHTWSDVPVHSVPPAIVADDGAERASHTSGDESSDSGVSPDQCIVSSDAIESNVAERPKPISTEAATPPRRLSVSLTQEGASGVGPAAAPLNAGERATSNLTATTVVSSSSSPFPCRTPARSSEAAVTALADLQQRLTGSNGAVVELHQQLKHVEEKLHEKEADIIRLTEKLAATEDALGALRRAATLEEATRQQQQQGEQGRRLCTPSPPPTRVTAATSTEQLPFSPSASTTRWCEGGAEEGEEGDTHSVASTCHAATENPSQLKGCTAATVYSLVESPKPAAALASAPPLETPFLSTESPAAPSPSPPPPRVQLLRRVHELEGELRNANFRMDQWRALLDAERHARIVQVDQLTQQLESESRRCARASRSRSRSLSPLGSGAGPFSRVENLAGGEAEPRQLQAPLPAPAFPPPSLPPAAAAAVMHPLTSMGGDLTLSPASPREQHETQLRQRIDTLTGQLHSTEAHAAGERTQRLAADECIKVLEREQRVLRKRLEAQENALQEALMQRRHHEQDADQREKILHREVESYRQTLATMQAAHAASNELQRSLMEELAAERRTRAAEAAAHRIAQDRLAADSEEVQKRLRCERDDAILKQEEALAHAAIEIQAGNSRVAALQQRIDSMANELRTTDAESREQRQRCVVAETQAVALDLARQALLDRVMALEEDLSSARAAWKQWQQDTDERERVLRHEYGESAASAHAASETQRRANSELQQRYDVELRTLQCSKAASDEAHRTAFEEATRKLTDAEIANRQVAEELCREREDHERTDAALQKAQAENEALRRRIDIVSEKLRLVELPAGPQRQQHTRISTLERELEEARAQQRDSLQQERDDFRTREEVFRRELETHAHTITALQKDKCAMEALQGRLEEVLHSEKLARAAEKAAHEAALKALQNQLSRAEQRALESIDALRREEDVHARTLDAFHATGEANRQLQLVRSAQEAHAEQCAQIWWSAREACAVKWMEAKTLLMVETFSPKRAELQLHEQQLQRRDVPSQPALLPISLSSTGAGQHPEKSRKRKEERSRSRSGRHRRSLPPDAVISVPTASAAPGLPPEMLVVSIDDPLGLCYELKCKTRHIASLKERVRQLEEAHCVDQQIVSTLQQLVAQEDLRNGSGLAAPSRVPPSAPSPTMGTSLWPPRSPPQATSRGWQAPDLTPAGSSDATVTSHHRGVRMGSGSSSPGGTTERRRMASNEYRQRYALL